MSSLIAIVPAADYLYTCRFSSNEETCYYLNGVFVDTTSRRLVATDSHRLGLLALLDDEMRVESEAASFILTNSKDLQRACKAGKYERLWLRCYDDKLEIVAGGSGSAAVDVAPESDMPQRLVATLPGANVYVDGTFPDYTRVMPTRNTGTVVETYPGKDGAPGRTETFVVNADLVASMKGPEPKQSCVKLLPNGDSPWLAFNTDPRFVGVLMPTRGGLALADAIAKLGAFMGWSDAAVKAAA